MTENHAAMPEDHDCPTWRTDWRAGRGGGGLGAKRRFPFRLSGKDRQPRPLVFLSLSAMVSMRKTVLCPALVDSGAHMTLAPASLCESLGLAFADGAPGPQSSGIGGSSGRAFSHACRLDLLAGPERDAETAFGPLDMPVLFIEADMPFVLLGQRGFLDRFVFTQAMPQGWFELEWLVAIGNRGMSVPGQKAEGSQ